MELKYYKMFSRTSALVSPRFISVVEFGTNDEVYEKSEADRYIGELKELHKEEVDELQKATDSAWCKVNAMYDEILHHKYKRCLAMAKIASDAWHLHNSFYLMGHQNFELKKCERYERHRLCWLALAEKFSDKEAK